MSMLITTKEQYEKVMAKFLGQDVPIALDTETEPFGGKKTQPWELEVEGVGLWTPECEAYILPELLDGEFQKLLKLRRLIFHNAKFDLAVLSGLGFDVEHVRFEDTLLMAWLVDETRPLGLKDLAEAHGLVEKAVRFDDVGPKPIHEGSVVPGADLKAWRDSMAAYCLQDCRLTYRLHDILVESLKTQGLVDVYEKQEKNFVQTLRRMERRGILVDLDHLSRMEKDLDVRLSEVEEKAKAFCREHVGRDLNIGSSKQLIEYFFTDKKYATSREHLTPKGHPSVNLKALEWLKRTYDDKLADIILEHRELSKLRSTYCVAFREKSKTDPLTGKPCINANFNQTGTVTGRLSSSNPNLQNVPTRDDEFDIRKAFIPRPGYVFVCADYSQVELRILAAFSKCKKMIETYKQGGDIHKTTADAVGCDRHTAKMLNFGINYGISAVGMSRRMEGGKMSEKQAQTFIDGYFQQFPEVKQFLDTSASTLRENHMIRTIAGRLRHFPEYLAAVLAQDRKTIHRMERQAANAAIQGSAGDIIKRAMIVLERALVPFDAHILLQVHDELVLECPPHVAEAVAGEVKRAMETSAKLGAVPLLTEPKISNLWTK